MCLSRTLYVPRACVHLAASSGMFRMRTGIAERDDSGRFRSAPNHSWSEVKSLWMVSAQLVASVFQEVPFAAWLPRQ